ncbi:MAG: hypothetical protein LR015_03195 [Verrucomicrobia bacterium]|nr:hypothetical protein [Verrucomicrobiota bacterium]
MSEYESSKFIPSLDAVKKAASQLPSAEAFKGVSVEIKIDDKHTVTFRRLKIKDSRGKKLSLGIRRKSIRRLKKNIL